MVIFHSYVSLPEGTSSLWYPNDIPSISPWSSDLGPGEVPRWAWARDEPTARHKEGAPEWAPQPGIFTVKNDMTDIGGEASEKWWEFRVFMAFYFRCPRNSYWLIHQGKTSMAFTFCTPARLRVDQQRLAFGAVLVSRELRVSRIFQWSPWSPSPRGGPCFFRVWRLGGWRCWRYSKLVAPPAK